MRDIEEYKLQLEVQRRRLEEKVTLKKMSGRITSSEFRRPLDLCRLRRWENDVELSNFNEDDVPTIVANRIEVMCTRVKTKCLKCRQRQERMKDFSCQIDEDDCPLQILELPKTILDVLQPPPADRTVQCRVVRDKKTEGSRLYPIYRMYLEEDNRLLLIARRRKKCSTSKYLILTSDEDLTRSSSSAVGKLRSNLVGTRFRLCTYETTEDSNEEEIDAGVIMYDTNVLGTKGPRKFKVVLPGLEDSSNSPDNSIRLVNKKPNWDEDTSTHFLYFRGRVTKRSVKNFQLQRDHDDSILLQFGKVGRDEFILDYQNPLSAVQAFGVSLSSFDHKIACE